MRNEKPILFSTMMVQALLAGRKTQTRRVLSEKFIINFNPGRYKSHGVNDEGEALFEDLAPGESTPWMQPIKCPYGVVGDWLWVRENWQYSYDLVGKNVLHEPQLSDIVFHADNVPASMMLDEKWRPSIHLKKVHSRLWLSITDIKIEQINDISENDAIAEGVQHFPIEGGYKDYNGAEVRYSYAVDSFESLWRSINNHPEKTEGWWVNNPWVWVITFKVMRHDQMKAITELEAAKA